MSQVTDNTEESRYELAVDGEIAVAAYCIKGERIVFTHTVVPSRLEGQGIGSRLVKAALDDVRRRRLRAVLQCPFVAAYIERHPDECDLLAGS